MMTANPNDDFRECGCCWLDLGGGYAFLACNEHGGVRADLCGVLTRAAFAADPAAAIRAADAGPVTVVGDDGATVMVLSTMEVDD